MHRHVTKSSLHIGIFRITKQFYPIEFVYINLLHDTIA